MGLDLHLPSGGRYRWKATAMIWYILLILMGFDLHLPSAGRYRWKSNWNGSGTYLELNGF